MAASGSIRPALIVVDMQEDFCPPVGLISPTTLYTKQSKPKHTNKNKNGSLAVQEGREISPTINTLLSKPGFIIRILTQDYHPRNHISFASNHPEPNNKPFESTIIMPNPAPGKQSETKPQQLWPIHCVADTPGAVIIPEIDASKADLVVQKGMHSQVEMYSVFADAFGNCDSGINAQSVSLDVATALRAKGVTDVFVVGLAGDYCVKCTAIDAVKAGFPSWVVEEATRCVVPDGWGATKSELEDAGVSVISIMDPVVQGI
jgi:nicotinamidase-related amidase